MSDVISIPRAQLDELLRLAEEAKVRRAANWPDEQSAMRGLCDCRTRLTELGWRDAMYAPADNSPLELIEAGSSGIHKGYRDKERRFWICDGDTWPSSPILFRVPNAASVVPPAPAPSTVPVKNPHE